MDLSKIRADHRTTRSSDNVHSSFVDNDLGQNDAQRRQKNILKILSNVEIFSVQDDVPFSEDEFRRRKAHPNFKEHYAIEKFVTKIGLTVKKTRP